MWVETYVQTIIVTRLTKCLNKHNKEWYSDNNKADKNNNIKKSKINI